MRTGYSVYACNQSRAGLTSIEKSRNAGSLVLNESILGISSPLQYAGNSRDNKQSNEDSDDVVFDDVEHLIWFPFLWVSRGN
jgi:hypothetical protein